MYGSRHITSGRPEYRNKQNGDAFNVQFNKIDEAIQEPDANTNIEECVRFYSIFHSVNFSTTTSVVDGAQKKILNFIIEIEIFPYAISTLGSFVCDQNRL